MTRLFRRDRIAGPRVSILPPFTIGLRQIYILPSRYGYLFIVILIGMLVGSVNYNNNLGFLLTFLLGSLSFVSLFHTHNNLSGIEVLACSASPVFAGQTAAVRITLSGRGRSRIAVSCRVARYSSDNHVVEARTPSLITVNVPTAQRGLVSPGPVSLLTRYPLGLFTAWSLLPLTIRLLVYPTPVPGPLVFSTAPSPSAKEDGMAKTRGVEDFQGLKAYQGGDPLQNIYWKALSKGQGLQVKEFQGCKGATGYLDWASAPAADIEKRLSILCGRVLKAHAHGMAYGLILPGAHIEPGRGDAHRHTCLKALALFGKNPAENEKGA